MNTSYLEKILAWAQIWLSVLLLGLIFAVIFRYETSSAHLTVDQQKGFDSLVDWLKSIGSLVVFFWFQRLRPGGIPDTSQTVTQTHTLPDGTKTTITSPVSAPAASIPTLPSTKSAPSPLDPSQTTGDTTR
jgi:hypothetical protein